MKLKTPNNIKNCGLPPPISYNPDQTIKKAPTDNSDSIKVDIKTKPW